MSFIRNGTAPAIAGKPAVGSQPSGMNGMIVTVVRNVPVEPRAPRTPNRLSQNPAYNRAKIVHSDAPKNRAPAQLPAMSMSGATGSRRIPTSASGMHCSSSSQNLPSSRAHVRSTSGFATKASSCQ